jgi:hypothetical protein
MYNSKEELTKDLAFMVKAGLLDVFMREDGQWVYVPTELGKSMTEERLTAILESEDDE